MVTLAMRIHSILVTSGLVPADTDPRNMLVAVEMADRVLELSFRGSAESTDGEAATFDQDILDIGRRALIAFASDLSRRPPT
jgi:hypothetical protein